MADNFNSTSLIGASYIVGALNIIELIPLRLEITFLKIVDFKYQYMIKV